jgi:hypothetical protein
VIAKLHNHSKFLVPVAVFLTAVQAVAFRLMPRGLARAAVSDIVCALLMFSVLLVVTLNGISSTGRSRLFWILQATGWGLWLMDQLLWIVFDLVLQQKMPAMFSADALLFMAGVPMLCTRLVRWSVGNSPRYCNFAYSALACFRMGMSGSASFQSVRKS